MNIKPKTGIRNYAKGGVVYDVEPEQAYLMRSKEASMSPHASDMTQSEFSAMTPDKLYPGSGYARDWKKHSPNG